MPAGRLVGTVFGGLKKLNSCNAWVKLCQKKGESDVKSLNSKVLCGKQPCDAEQFQHQKVQKVPGGTFGQTSGCSLKLNAKKVLF